MSKNCMMLRKIITFLFYEWLEKEFKKKNPILKKFLKKSRSIDWYKNGPLLSKNPV